MTFIVLGIEGSANKIGIGVITETGEILSNPRKTFITPPGTGFLPSETAEHHRKHILSILKGALALAKITMKQINLICFPWEALLVEATLLCASFPSLVGL